MKRVIALLMIIAACVTLSGTGSVNALDCAEPAPAAEELARSSVAFVGKALAASKEGLTVFEVELAWKGVSQSRIEVYDNGWDSYAPGQTYLVFGGFGDGKLRTHLCGQSGPWDAAREQAMKQSGMEPVSIPAVDGGSSQHPAPPSSTDTSLFAAAAYTVLFLLAILIVAISLGKLRRRNRR